jgi:hypothetical protein
MKRLLLIGFAACTFALAPILSASAMPIAHPNALTGDSSSTIQVLGWSHHGGGHGWGHHVAEVITMDGVEATDMDKAIITVSENITW